MFRLSRGDKFCLTVLLCMDVFLGLWWGKSQSEAEASEVFYNTPATEVWTGDSTQSLSNPAVEDVPHDLARHVSNWGGFGSRQNPAGQTSGGGSAGYGIVHHHCEGPSCTCLTAENQSAPSPIVGIGDLAVSEQLLQLH